MINLYREEILEHYREPLNFGKLAQFNKSSKQVNPFCGDEIEMRVKFNDEVVKDISFFGKGCAISLAASSILTEYAKGKTKKQLTKFSEKDMLTLLGIEISETRKKCAMLPLVALKKCV